MTFDTFPRFHEDKLYITTLRDRTAEEVVELTNGRCDQENVIE